MEAVGADVGDVFVMTSIIQCPVRLALCHRLHIHCPGSWTDGQGMHEDIVCYISVYSGMEKQTF